MGKAEKSAVAVIKPVETAVATVPEVTPVPEYDTKDLLIPKLLLMQPLSDFVKDEKARQGQIVRSLTAKHVPDLRIIPIMQFKTWVESEQVNGKQFEFRRVVPMTDKNSELPFEWSENGAKWQRDRSLNFYVLVQADIAAEVTAQKKFDEDGEIPDVDLALIPHLVSFRRTSYRAGRELINHFAKCDHFSRPGRVVPPSSKAFSLTGEKVDGDQGFYFVYKVGEGVRTSKEEMDIAQSWAGKLHASRVKVHETGEEVNTAPAAANPEPVPTGKQTF